MWCKRLNSNRHVSEFQVVLTVLYFVGNPVCKSVKLKYIFFRILFIFLGPFVTGAAVGTGASLLGSFLGVGK